MYQLLSSKQAKKAILAFGLTSGFGAYAQHFYEWRPLNARNAEQNLYEYSYNMYEHSFAFVEGDIQISELSPLQVDQLMPIKRYSRVYKEVNLEGLPSEEHYQDSVLLVEDWMNVPLRTSINNDRMQVFNQQGDLLIEHEHDEFTRSLMEQLSAAGGLIHPGLRTFDLPDPDFLASQGFRVEERSETFLSYSSPEGHLYYVDLVKLTQGMRMNNEEERSETEKVTVYGFFEGLGYLPIRTYTSRLVNESFGRVFYVDEVEFTNHGFWHHAEMELENTSISSQLVVYPNPLGEILNANWLGELEIPIISLRIRDVFGREVFSQAFSAQTYSFEISTQGLPRGILFAEIETNIGLIGRTLQNP